MKEFANADTTTPIVRELEHLYGKYIPEEDVLDIKGIIRKYFIEKYSERDDLQFAEMGAVREDFSGWAHDPGK